MYRPRVFLPMLDLVSPPMPWRSYHTAGQFQARRDVEVLEVRGSMLEAGRERRKGKRDEGRGKKEKGARRPSAKSQKAPEVPRCPRRNAGTQL